MILKIGSRGGDVLAWQTVLSKVGYALALDGIFGPETEGRTKEYQVVLGVSADGIVGEKTLAAHAAVNPEISFAREREVAEMQVQGDTASAKKGAGAIFLIAGAMLAYLFFSRKK